MKNKTKQNKKKTQPKASEILYKLYTKNTKKKNEVRNKIYL